MRSRSAVLATSPTIHKSPQRILEGSVREIYHQTLKKRYQQRDIRMSLLLWLNTF